MLLGTAPAAFEDGEYIYYMASAGPGGSVIHRTNDPVDGKWEEVSDLHSKKLKDELMPTALIDCPPKNRFIKVHIVTLKLKEIKKMKKDIIVLCIIILFSASNIIARDIISINKNWQFSANIASIRGLGWGRGASNAEIVDLTHTWNESDFLSDGGYRRGYGTYVKKMEIPTEYKGKRLFVKFEGAGTIANVFVNSKHLGEHKGAYNAFTYEITDQVVYGEQNTIIVVCNNARQFDVAPQGGDFNSYGGLYRDAWLIVTDDDACISPLYYSSTGVLINQLYVSKERAELRAEIHLSTKSDYENCTVEFAVIDASDHVVSTQLNSNLVTGKVACNVGIDNPHLWNGAEDPYLYKTVTILKRNGQEIDRIEENIGIRSFYVDADKGFFLNGEHIKLRGVCRHQDWAEIASALTKENHLVDYDFFEEMGVNALRLAHYPQAKFMFQEADRRGYVVWEEIPFVGGYVNSEGFDKNLKLQLKEMIIQNFNHPSICFWGIFNEIHGDDFADITGELNELAHELDPSRLTVCANDQDASSNLIPDLLAWNKYFGWYYGIFNELGPFYDDLHTNYPNLKLGLSEYGAGASFNQHIPKYDSAEDTIASRGKWHPQEKQTASHISHLKMISERDFIWGSFVWNMFDFASNFRREGDTPHINDKGLVSHDRKQRKDAFYLYKANWNKNEKTTHLCSKSFTEREENVTDIVAFTTAPSAKLYINGKQIGKMNTDDYATVIWEDVKLNSGENAIEIRTEDGKDSAVWTVK